MRFASNGLSTFRGDGQMDAHFETRLPAPILRPFISHYGGARVRGLTPGVNTTLPSRHAHLIISLDAPIKLVTAPHTPVPFSPPMEQFYIPNPERIAQVVRSIT